MKAISEIEFLTQKVLALNPSPAAQLRLLRDVLLLEPDQPEVRAAAKLADQSRHVQLLAAEQRERMAVGELQI